MTRTTFISMMMTFMSKTFGFYISIFLSNYSYFFIYFTLFSFNIHILTTIIIIIIILIVITIVIITTIIINKKQ